MLLLLQPSCSLSRRAFSVALLAVCRLMSRPPSRLATLGLSRVLCTGVEAEHCVMGAQDGLRDRAFRCLLIDMDDTLYRQATGRAFADLA